MRTEAPPARWEAWELTIPALPPRSRLYHLAPLGVGTPGVESLTSYLARLAAAHGVAIPVLVAAEIAPLLALGQARLSRHRVSAFLRQAGQTLNGLGTTAAAWHAALAALTGRRDLAGTTLCPWAGALAKPGLLRDVPAWCPACLDERRQAGQPDYLPLLWHLAVVGTCPRHHRRLVDRCPAPGCGQPQYLRKETTLPGTCWACGAWLGTAAPPGGDETRDGGALARERWVAAAVGPLLAAPPASPDPADGTALAAAIRRCVDDHGGVQALADAVQLPAARLHGWATGATRPTLPALLHLCAQLGTAPLPFLRDATAAPAVVARAAPPTAPWRDQGVRFDHAAARALLDATLREPPDPPPSVAALARRLGCPAVKLRQRFPERCRRISARWRAQRDDQVRQRRQARPADIRRTVFALHAQGRYPSQERVSAALALPKWCWGTREREAWWAARRECGWG